MSQYREEKLEKSITKELEELTEKGKLSWHQIGYTFTASYLRLIFVIEDTGQNWLEIMDENCRHIETVRDWGNLDNVGSLLETIKYTINRPKPYSAVHTDLRSGRLSYILEQLNKEEQTLF